MGDGQNASLGQQGAQGFETASASSQNMATLTPYILSKGPVRPAGGEGSEIDP